MTGRKVELPEGAVVIYPHRVVTDLFGYKNDGSTRKTMSEFGSVGQSGWPVEDVHEAMDELRPGWRGSKSRRGKNGSQGSSGSA